jgi:tetratricopeptide (TPR) repeat protein
MKHQVPIVLLVLALCASAQAQTEPYPVPATSPNPPSGDPSAERIAVFSGKVLSEEGSALPESAAVVLECGNKVLARAQSDSSGDFSLTFALRDGADRPDRYGDDKASVSYFSLADCELYGELPGYQSEHVRPASGPDTGLIQVGTIILHPISSEGNGGSSVSAITLAAPDKAMRALEKGREQEKKGKWAVAAAYFKRAVEVYPRFALAWVELGRTQVQQKSFAEAQQSFQQSVEQDSKFVDGYAGLAYVALQQNHWKELADATDRMVEFAPDSAQFWFLNAVANFNLGKTDQAENSLGRGLRLDPKHQIPEMEYLYGLILARRNDYSAAAEHVSTYLGLAPHAANSDAARKALADFQQHARPSTGASR